MTTARRILGALLALLGTLLLVAVVPVLAHLDGHGRAAFTAPVDTDGIVSIDQHVLNRVDAPVEVTARGTDAEKVFVGVAAPSAVRHLIGESQVQRVTGVDVNGWQLDVATQGKGTTAEPSLAPIWDRRATGTGTASLTLEQVDAPQRVLVTTPSGGKVDTVELAWTRAAWRTGAIWLTVLGALLVLAGLALALLRRLPGRRDRDVLPRRPLLEGDR